MIAEQLDVSVVVCAKNRASVLGRCLRAIEHNAPLEIIVVDGDSEDATAEIARQYTDRVWSDLGRGLGYARQLGAEQARGQYVAYVDSDVVLPPGTVEQLLVELKSHDYAGIRARVLAAEPANYWQRAQQSHIELTLNREGPTTTMGTIATLFRKQVLLDVGFDTSLGGAEDADLCRRLTGRGHRLGIGSAVVYHDHRADLRGVARQGFWYGMARGRLFRKHPTVLALVAALPIPFVGLARALVACKPQLLPYYAVAKPPYTAGFCCGFFESILRSAATVWPAEESPPRARP